LGAEGIAATLTLTLGSCQIPRSARSRHSLGSRKLAGSRVREAVETLGSDSSKSPQLE
jgi:hypothetical protein